MRLHAYKINTQKYMYVQVPSEISGISTLNHSEDNQTSGASHKTYFVQIKKIQGHQPW